MAHYWQRFESYNRRCAAKYRNEEPELWFRYQIQRTRVPKAIAVLVDDATNLQPTDALEAAKVFQQSRKLYLVLGGSFGTGKSVAAAWLIWAESGLYVSAPRLAASNIYDTDSWEQFLRRRWLCVDDYGTEYAGKGAAAAKFDALLADRAAEGYPTVMTTNATETRFRDSLSPRMRDRFFRDGVFFEAKGQSMRRQ